MAEKAPQYGYPSPGPQNISSDDIMNSLYFLNDEQWDIERRNSDYDYVVIGSSFCAYAFVNQVLQNKPDAKIMMLERGVYYHPEHFQNLPPAFVTTVGGTSETFPWTITKKTHEGQYIKWQHGMNNFFGGRSSFWSAWCPEPTDDEMTDWPKETKRKVHEYFDAAKKLLNVIPADKICEKELNAAPIFGELQSDVQQLLQDLPSNVPTITRQMPAPLAVGAQMFRNMDYEKYSVPGPLLGLLLMNRIDEGKQITQKESSLKIMINCLVTKIHHLNGKARVLETSKGDFVLGDAKVVLAMGTLPPTTLMHNSFSKTDFPLLTHIGERFTAHFISSIIARVPAETMPQFRQYGNLEIGAVYIAGKERNSGNQFHVQLSAVYDSEPWKNIYDTIRHLPDVVAAPSMHQLLTSEGYVIFVCAVLGELDHQNSENWFRHNDDKDITTNSTLQAVANSIDNAVWDAMDEATFEILNILAPRGLQYWHSYDKSGCWEYARPSTSMIRVPGLVHEASTMWLGEDKGSPVDLEYRFKGVENVYLTGASLWPTGGSWNPTCAMSGLAMHLADLICPKIGEATSTTRAVPLFNQKSKTGKGRKSKTGSRQHVDLHFDDELYLPPPYPIMHPRHTT